METAGLDSLLTDARRATSAEAGTVYIREGNALHFAVSHNDALARRLGEAQARVRLKGPALPLSDTSIAAYVALTRATVTIDDVYDIPPTRPYTFNPEVDRTNDYRSRSMLAMPLRDSRGTVFGVLQIINRLDADSHVVPFDRECQERVAALIAARAPALASPRPRGHA